MTLKERMICALWHEKPDRLSVTVYKWQKFYTYTDEMDALSAFKSLILLTSDHFFEMSVENVKICRGCP